MSARIFLVREISKEISLSFNRISSKQRHECECGKVFDSAMMEVRRTENAKVRTQEVWSGNGETKHSLIIILMRFMNHKDLTRMIHEKYSECYVRGYKGIIFYESIQICASKIENCLYSNWTRIILQYSHSRPKCYYCKIMAKSPLSTIDGCYKVCKFYC